MAGVYPIIKRSGGDPTTPGTTPALQMLVLSETGTPFTEAQLDAAFKKVADPSDWRNPINYAVVDRDDVHVTVCAIQYYTAAPVQVKDLQWNDEYMIFSPGYRLGPAGC